MDFMQFIRRKPAIEACCMVAIGDHNVPYVNLRLETVSTLEPLLEQPLPASPYSRAGSPQGSDVLAQAMARKGVSVIEAISRESAAGQTRPSHQDFPTRPATQPPKREKDDPAR